jgi:hypothetical protein
VLGSDTGLIGSAAQRMVQSIREIEEKT